MPNTPKVDWQNIDWSKRNIDIARFYGVSREIVRRRRKQYRPRKRKPKRVIKSLHYHGALMLAARKAEECLTIKELSEECGVPQPTLRRFAKRYGIELPNERGTRWSTCDWRLPNDDLQKIHAVKNVAVIRKRYSTPEQEANRWYKRGKHVRKALKDDIDYQLALIEEIDRFKRWRIGEF